MKQITDTNKDENTTIDNNPALVINDSDLLTSVDYEVVGVVPDKPNTIYLKVKGFVDEIVAHKYGM